MPAGNAYELHETAYSRERTVSGGPGHIMACVSVITPTFNRAHLIGETMRSILAQTFDDLEILVIDDGSTDNTSEVIVSLGDPRIRFIPLPHSGSISSVRNRGIREAGGQYITFLDSDDLWSPQAVMTLKGVLDGNPALGLSYGRVERRGPCPDRRIDRHLARIRMRSGNVFPPLLLENFILTQAVMVRKEAFSKAGIFDEELNISIGEDWEFFLRLAWHYPVGAADETLGYYVTHGANTNKDSIKSCQDEIRILNKICAAFPVKKELAALALARRHFVLGKCRLLMGDERFREDFRTAFSLHRAGFFTPAGLLLASMPLSAARSIYALLEQVVDSLRSGGSGRL
jgi:glycosyltransferase involved in cell wall biosynthesis